MSRHKWMIAILVVGVLFMIRGAQAQEQNKPALTVEEGCVKGLVYKFDEKAAASFSKKKAEFDLPIVLFNAEDYTIDHPERLAMIPVDSFGYPRQCNAFDDIRESSAREEKE